MTAGASTAAPPAAPPKDAARPPLWLVLATAGAALLILLLAVAETSIKAAYLVDTRGEFISLFGLAFIVAAGLYLWRRGSLYASLPLVLPWLLYPIVTQGDQIIDNLSINAMRVICHVLLAAIFAAPVAVIVLAARRAFPWIGRGGAAYLTSALFVAEIWLAQMYLGAIMIAIQIVMAAAALAVGVMAGAGAPIPARRQRSERFALFVLLAGAAVSLGTYVGYRNAPGAYQGSPSFFMDPAQKDANYRFDRIAVPGGSVTAPPAMEDLRVALTMDAEALNRLFEAYHLLNRNYTYDYHNELFLRRTPLVPDYRRTGLLMAAEASRLYADADARTQAIRRTLRADNPLAAMLDEVRAYMAFLFNRAPVLERMSASFDRTKAGLQHSAHLYEGETKYLGSGLHELLQKHQRVFDAPVLSSATSAFSERARRIYNAYADRIVGF